MAAHLYHRRQRMVCYDEVLAIFLSQVTCADLIEYSSMAWFGYDQGVFSGVLISADFKKHFPETEDANVSGITSSCFAVC